MGHCHALCALLSVVSTLSARVYSVDNLTSIDIATDGSLTIYSGSSPLAQSLTGTSLRTCKDVAVRVSSAGVVVTISRVVSCGAVEVVVEDLFQPANHSVLWTYNLYTPTPASFSVPIITSLRYVAEDEEPRYWTAWGNGCVLNNGSFVSGLCCSKGEWRNPLLAKFIPEFASYRLGSRYGERTSGSYANDSLTIPVVVVVIPSSNASSSYAFTMALDPADNLQDTTLVVCNTSQTVSFERSFLRISPTPLTGRTHVAAHAALTRSSVLFVPPASSSSSGPAIDSASGKSMDKPIESEGEATSGGGWRRGLAFVVEEFSTFFRPASPGLRERVATLEGLGSYSWNLQPYDSIRANTLGFKLNWDLSGVFMPYDGLFIPYQEPWLNLGPINPGLDQYNCSIAMMDAYYAAIQKEGFHSLSYFDIGNFGVNVNLPAPKGPAPCGRRPDGGPGPCWSPGSASSSFLQEQLSTALLSKGWSPGGGFFDKYILDWVGTTLMDPADPQFQDLLVDQATRHATLPHFEGFAVDRLDYSELYNLNADDGISWVPWDSSGTFGPARSLRVSHRETFKRLVGELGTRAPNAIWLMNCNTLCRIDLLEEFSGTFSEGSSLNAVAWTGLKAPAWLWTYELAGQTGEQLDQYFQQHLVMGVYPSAPMPKNDHMILPGNETVEQYYRDYAPLFDAIHGRDWLLPTEAEPVWVSGSSKAAVNIFTIPSFALSKRLSESSSELQPTLVIPLVLGAPDEQVQLVVDLRCAWSRLALEPRVRLLYPGGQVVPLVPPPLQDGLLLLSVPLADRGAVLVQVSEDY